MQSIRFSWHVWSRKTMFVFRRSLSSMISARVWRKLKYADVWLISDQEHGFIGRGSIAAIDVQSAFFKLTLFTPISLLIVVGNQQCEFLEQEKVRGSQSGHLPWDRVGVCRGTDWAFAVGRLWPLPQHLFHSAQYSTSWAIPPFSTNCLSPFFKKQKHYCCQPKSKWIKYTCMYMNICMHLVHTCTYTASQMYAPAHTSVHKAVALTTQARLIAFYYLFVRLFVYS